MTWDLRKLRQQSSALPSAIDVGSDPAALPSTTAVKLVPSVAYHAALMEDSDFIGPPLPPTPGQRKHLAQHGLIHEGDWSGIRRRMYRGLEPDSLAFDDDGWDD